MDQSVGPRVTSKSRFKTFFENLVELGLKSVNVADAWRARGHPFGLLFLKFKKIEIVTAPHNFFGARESFFGNRKERKARRQRERLLRASEHGVDPERVHVDLDGGKRRD